MNDFAKHEEMLKKYVDQGRTGEAVELLFKLIVAYAKEKDFVRAEALREKIFDVDAMALDAIIKSADIIEQEKSEAVDRSHMDIWSGLYETLTTEEANILYFAMKKAEYGPDETIFAQGQKNSRLFFIDQGQLKLSYSQNGTDKLIRTINSGLVAGDDTFFSITLCTTSLVTLSRVKLNYIEQETFARWQKELPVLASKVETYCSRLTKNHDVLKEKGMSRRNHKRAKVSGSVQFQVLDRNGKPLSKAFKGDLSDISLGGLSFFIKTSNRKNALMLLGRNLRIKFVIPMRGKSVEVDQSGIITGVINHLFSDYSIHMKFDKLLSKVFFDEVEQTAALEKNN